MYAIMIILIPFLLFILLYGIYLCIYYPNKLMLYSIALLSINFDRLLPHSGIDVTFVNKLLILLSSLMCMKKYGVKKSAAKLFAICGCLLFISTITFHSYKLYEYSYNDLITSFATIFLGVMLYSISWNDSDKIKIMKLLMYMPLIPLIVGLPLSFAKYTTMFYEGRLGGATISMYLGMHSTIGIMSALILSNIVKNKSMKYKLFAYLNFGITCLTITRGAIISASIILLPEILEILKKSLKNVKILIAFIFTCFLSYIPIMKVYQAFLQRTYVDGTLNTSNRLDAWSYLLEISKNNRIFGEGLGFIKTITDNEIAGKGFNAAHNEYVRFIVESGVVGTIIIVIIIFIMYKECFEFYVIKKRVYLIGYIIAFIVYSSTDNTVSAIQFWASYTILLGVLCESKKNNKAKKFINKNLHSNLKEEFNNHKVNLQAK